MRKIILITFAITQIILSPAYLFAQELDKFPLPRLLSSDQFNKTKDELIDNVTIDNKKITLSPPCGDIFGAAYYSFASKLTIVENDGTVRMYKGKNNFYKIYGMQSLDYIATTENVRFTRIPELLYLLVIDTFRAIDLANTPKQSYPDRFIRINLSGLTGYEGIPSDTNASKEGILIIGAYYYRSTPKSIYLNLDVKKEIHLEFTGEIDDPFRTGPGDPLAQSLFIFPEKSIVTKLTTGWAIHDMNGKLIKEFNDPIKERWNWWEHPIFKDNNFFVIKRTGPGGIKYKLDVQSGNMIVVENNN